MIRATGLRQDDGRHPRKPFAALKTRLRGTPRGWADLTGHCPPVIDQGPIGSCVGCGVLTAAHTSLAAHGTPLAWGVSSVDMTYKVARCLDRASDYPLRTPETYPALTDRGTMVLSGVEAVREWGVLPSQYPMHCDCTPDSVNREPDLRTLIVAGRKLLVGAYELSHEQLETQLSLDGGVAVATGGWVDGAFMRAGPAAIIGAQDFNDRDGGGHCNAIVGYRTMPDDSVLYRLLTSWGPDWADKGYAWVTGAFLRQQWEAYALAVEVRT